MSLWRKFNTLIKATSHAPIEALVESNSIQIFEQEIRDAESSISKAKRELACVMAEKVRLERHNTALEENIASKEQQTLKALEKGEELLAAELAGLIATDEQLLTDQVKQLKYLTAQESRLRQQLKEVVNSIARYRSELRLAKANQNAENAITHLKGCSSGLNGHLGDMADSLSRIKEKQQGFRDFDEALSIIESDCSGQSLDKKLSDVGIDNGKLTGEKVLERLKNRNAA